MTKNKKLQDKTPHWFSWTPLVGMAMIACGWYYAHSGSLNSTTYAMGSIQIKIPGEWEMMAVEDNASQRWVAMGTSGAVLEIGILKPYVFGVAGGHVQYLKNLYPGIEFSGNSGDDDPESGTWRFEFSYDNGSKSGQHWVKETEDGLVYIGIYAASHSMDQWTDTGDQLVEQLN